MGKQLQHQINAPGAPCNRCGLVYSHETAYIACFEEGDTFDTWLARQPDKLRKALNTSTIREIMPTPYIGYSNETLFKQPKGYSIISAPTDIKGSIPNEKDKTTP